MSGTASAAGGNFYVVSGHKPTAVSHCITGNFTSSTDINLIVAKFSHLEVYYVQPEGLKLSRDIPIFGRLCCLESFRPPGSEKDFLFMLTKKHDAAILEFVPGGQMSGNEFEVLTRCHGNMRERVGRPSEYGPKATVDPKCRCIAIRIYDGNIKIIPMTPEMTEMTAFIVRCEEINIIDMTFLHGCDSSPTLCLIYNTHAGRHAKTYEINVSSKDLCKGPWKQDNIEIESSMVVPVPAPLFGVLIIAAQSITYHQGEHYSPIAPPIIKDALITVCAPIDYNRFLLGDMKGRIFLLQLQDTDSGADNPKVKNLEITLLGHVTIPECITYLDNCYVFVGSKLGDSQVLKLNEYLVPENESNISIVETITNLGPIVDLTVVRNENQGPDEIVTCCGVDSEGTLRIIRNGIGIQEMASIDLFGIKGVWTLKLDSKPPNYFHNVLVLSFVGQTRMLRLTGEDVEEFDIPGFSCDSQTLFAGNVSHGQIVQVTSHFVRLVDDTSGQVLTEWKPPSTYTISKVTCNASQIVLATGRKVYYLVIKERLVFQVGREFEMPYEVACLDITPITDSPVSEFVAVGLWTDITARVFLLPGENQSEFVEIESCTQKLGGEIIPRSCMMCKLDDVPYLLYALGDGSLVYFKFDYLNRVLSERRKINLGTQPTTLSSFETNGGTTKNIFACSDRPTVIYSVSKKLLFSNVNLRQVTHMCSINAEAYQNCLVLCNESTLTIGAMDQIQKLHIRTIHLYETPMSMAFQKETQTYALLTIRDAPKKNSNSISVNPNAASIAALSHSGYTEERQTVDFPQSSPVEMDETERGVNVLADSGLKTETSTSATVASTSRSNYATPGTAASSGNENEISDDMEISNVVILDQHTCEPLHAFRLNPNERAFSIISATLEEDAPFYVVGTTYVLPHQAEPDKGRLLVLEWKDSKLHLVAEKEIKGCPYSIQLFNGKILCAVNHMVELYEWAADKELRLDCCHYGNIIALHLKTKGDFVIVGDLLKSVSLLLYKPQESSFEEIAKDYTPLWTTAVEILDDDTFLVGENDFNIYTVTKDSAAATNEERRKLSITGRYHINDLINVFRHGSLVMNNPSESVMNYQPSILFGTVSGAIGLIVQLPPKLFTFLLQLQERIVATVNSVGKISHSSWRDFCHDFGAEPALSFVDGDVIEIFLDMTVMDREKVLKGLSFNPNTINQRQMNVMVDNSGDDVLMNESSIIGVDSPLKPQLNTGSSICVDDVVKLIEDLARLH